jgi:hypothetical protein
VWKAHGFGYIPTGQLAIPFAKKDSMAVKLIADG